MDIDVLNKYFEIFYKYRDALNEYLKIFQMIFCKIVNI